jgi:hypothetical protein
MSSFEFPIYDFDCSYVLIRTELAVRKHSRFKETGEF